MSYDKFIDNIFIENNQYNSYIYQNNNELFLFPDYSVENNNNNNINIYNVNNLISNIEVDFLSNILLYDEIDYTEYLFIKNHNVTDNIYLVNKSLSIIVNINKLTKILTKTNINEKINYSLDNSFSEINTKTSKSILYNDNIYITSAQTTLENINTILFDNSVLFVFVPDLISFVAYKPRPLLSILDFLILYSFMKVMYNELETY